MSFVSQPSGTMFVHIYLFKKRQKETLTASARTRAQGAELSVGN